MSEQAGSTSAETIGAHPAEPGASAIRFDGVTKRFDDVVAVDNLNLQINDGEFFSLLGPSGCGKTTTLRMIAGLEFPTQGGADPPEGDGIEAAEPPAREHGLSVLRPVPTPDVADNIAFGLHMRKVDRATIRTRVAEAVQLVRSGWQEHRRPRSSPVVSSSESRWPVRWSTSHRSCCWTSRSERSTSSCARPMQVELKELQRGWASRSCT